jgi:hypothetical protein
MSSVEDGEYETWITHDSIGVSHVIRIRKGAPPRQVRCAGCDD